MPVLLTLCALLAATQCAHAEFFYGQSAGIPDPTRTLTFSDGSLSAPDVLFSGFRIAGTPEESGGPISGYYITTLVGVRGAGITFLGAPVQEASFGLPPLGQSLRFEAYLGGFQGLRVDSGILDVAAPAGYAGFRGGPAFDTILVVNAAVPGGQVPFSLDNLQFRQAVPEPATGLMLSTALAIVALACSRRRRALADGRRRG